MPHMPRAARCPCPSFFAARFIGNSVSTFAALGLVERRHRGRWAAYYNGGNIPLASVMPPLHRLPWVFTYNSWSSHYDYMLKAAVRYGWVWCDWFYFQGTKIGWGVVPHSPPRTARAARQ